MLKRMKLGSAATADPRREGIGAGVPLWWLLLIIASAQSEEHREATVKHKRNA